MRHSWKKKLKGRYKVIGEEDGYEYEKIAGDVFECEHCKLRRGTERNRWSMKTIYFDKKNKILSLNKLPFKCIGKEMREDFVFSKEDFML